MGEAVHVGEHRLLGEVIRVSRDRIVAQVYGDTTGLRPGDRVEGSGNPLSVVLGPHRVEGQTPGAPAYAGIAPRSNVATSVLAAGVVLAERFEILVIVVVVLCLAGLGRFLLSTGQCIGRGREQTANVVAEQRHHTDGRDGLDRCLEFGLSIVLECAPGGKLIGCGRRCRVV